ncbi:PLD nuclease N-terminal domain-containing protein [Mycolicibacterium cosmeticum]
MIATAALLWAWSIADVIAADDGHVQHGEKAAWVALVMAVPVVGAVAWLLLGRAATRQAGAALLGDTPYGWPPHAASPWGGRIRPSRGRR